MHDNQHKLVRWILDMSQNPTNNAQEIMKNIQESAGHHTGLCKTSFSTDWRLGNDCYKLHPTFHISLSNKIKDRHVGIIFTPCQHIAN